MIQTINPIRHRGVIKRIIRYGFAFMLVSSLQANPATYSLQIQNHRFIPVEISVPANQKIKLIVKNNDATAEEFESYDLNREKIVPGNSEISVFIGPLKAGTYRFFGEFNQNTAQGTIKVLDNASSEKRQGR